MLPLSGERTAPGVPHDNYWYARHVAAYRFAAARCGGLRVLDAGAGEGYGTALLAHHAAAVIGVDVAVDAVAHARVTYPGTAFFCAAGLEALPLASGSVDAVVCLQVIEHLWDVPAALAELARALVPGGWLWCATPNRLTFAPGNPFHVREYAPAELLAALSPTFRVQALYGVHHGPRLRAVELLSGRPLPDRILAHAPHAWPRWLAAAVAAVRPTDFDLRIRSVQRSLDLLAVATRR